MPVHIVPDTVPRTEDYPLDGPLLRALWQMEDGHFWHRARNRWILRALERRGVKPAASFLEIGCGAGAVTRTLHKAGYTVTGVDPAEVLVRKAAERCPTVRFVVADVAALDASTYGPFEGIGYFDVLEHLDDPAGLLTGSLRLAAPNALVIATVPARRSLGTVIDDLSGHKRRYEPDELGALLQRCGLVDIEEQGIFRLTAPLQRWSRRRLAEHTLDALSPAEAERTFLRNFRVPPWPINAAMDLLCRLEATVGTPTQAGATLLATGRWPASGP
jgi:SAM-dependent methyltransferase